MRMSRTPLKVLMKEAAGKPVPVIFDGDMGGDDAWAITIMLAHPDRFRVLGISSVFGNVDLDKATRNVCNLLAYTGHHHIPVYAGNHSPLQGPNRLGDDAYGKDGFGGVDLGIIGASAQDMHAVTWMTEVLRNTAEKITIFATGPLTNLAMVLQSHPSLVEKVDRLVVMGGGLAPGPCPDIPGRSGNITQHAEFNFFQDPYAVNIVAQSGVKIDLLTMDSNQHLDLNATRRAEIRDLHTDIFGDYFVRMMDSVAPLDIAKFGVEGAFVHDSNVVIHTLAPDLYWGKRGIISVEHNTDSPDTPFSQLCHGRLHFTENASGNVQVLLGMTNPGRVFDIIKESFSRMADHVYAVSQKIAPEHQPGRAP